MLYLYLDESGDLGFDFVGSKPSKFFVITVLAIKGSHHKNFATKMVQRTLRYKVNFKKKKNRMIEELKGTSTTLSTKRYLLRKLEKIDFSIYALVLNKKRTYSDFISNKSRVYNWVARALLDKIEMFDAKTRVVLTLDRNKNTGQKREFNQYIEQCLESKIPPKTPLDIFHEDSCTHLGLNIVDLFSWGIFRKYERKNTIWYDEFKDKVQYEGLYET